MSVPSAPCPSPQTIVPGSCLASHIAYPHSILFLLLRCTMPENACVGLTCPENARSITFSGPVGPSFSQIKTPSILPGPGTHSGSVLRAASLHGLPVPGINSQHILIGWRPVVSKPDVLCQLRELEQTSTVPYWLYDIKVLLLLAKPGCHKFLAGRENLAQRTLHVIFGPVAEVLDSSVPLDNNSSTSAVASAST